MTDVGEIHETRDGFEWRIKNFLNLSGDHEYYWSPRFSCNGVDWFFRIYPKGKGGNGYVELRLVKRDANPISISFSVALKSVNGVKYGERQYTENFEWGLCIRTHTQFISRRELERKKTQLLPSGILTIVFTPTISTSACEDKTATASCSYCKKIFNAEKLSCHEEKCRVKCPECSDVILLEKWDEHECQISRAEECSYCKKTLNVENISVHEKKCMDRPIRCPECSEIVLLQTWYDHECQAPGAEYDTPLCEDLKEMLLNGMNHDLILKVGDKELKAHQDVLRTRSQVFKSMLSHDTKEKNSGVVDIPDCDPQAMEEFLCYVYTGKVDLLDESIMLKLYYIADKYDMKGLKRKCCTFIKKSLSYTNTCEVIQLALNHSDSSLLEHATEYFKDNTLDIMCTVEWQTFLMENSTVANELMMKSFQKFKNAST